MVGFISSYLIVQVGNDNRQLVFLYERGKKKLMDGSRMVFPSKCSCNFYVHFILHTWQRVSHKQVCIFSHAMKACLSYIRLYIFSCNSEYDNLFILLGHHCSLCTLMGLEPICREPAISLINFPTNLKIAEDIILQLCIALHL